MNELEPLESTLLEAARADDAIKMAEAVLNHARVVSPGHADAASHAVADVMRNLALRRIALVQAEAGQFSSAIETARGIRTEGESMFASTLTGIAVAQAKAGEFVAAMQTLGEITPELERCRAVMRFSAEESIRERRAVLEVARRFEDTKYRSTALTTLAISQARAGDIASASEIVSEIESPASRVTALSWIAVEQAKHVDATAAKLTIADAMTTADKIHEVHERDLALQAIANAQSHAGDHESAIETAYKIETPGLLVWSLISIAAIWRRAGDTLQAKTDLFAAMQVLPRIENEGTRPRAFGDIVLGLAEAGHCEDALKLARDDDIPESRRESLLSSIAVVQARHNEYAKAQETFGLLTQPVKQAWVLKKIGTAQAKAGEWETANETWEAAIEYAGAVGDLPKQAFRLAEIAREQARAGFNEAARKTFFMARRAAEGVEDGSVRSWTLEYVAYRQASVGHGESAVQTAELISTEQDTRLPRIAEALVSTGDKENFKRLLLPCAQYLDAAYAMCGLLAKLYPEQATAIAEVVRG